jgi:hypothetical protein
MPCSIHGQAITEQNAIMRDIHKGNYKIVLLGLTSQPMANKQNMQWL